MTWQSMAATENSPDRPLCASVRGPAATLLSPETAPRMRELQIRKAEPADASIIGPLVQRAIRARNAADYEPAIIEMMCANFAPDKFLERMAARDVFAAVQDGDIIGTVSFSLPRCQALFPVHRAARPARRHRQATCPPHRAARQDPRLHRPAAFGGDHRQAVLRPVGLCDDPLRGTRRRRLDLADEQAARLTRACTHACSERSAPCGAASAPFRKRLPFTPVREAPGKSRVDGGR